MRTIRLPQVQNIGPNQRASLRIPLGATYQKLYLQLGGNILASLMTDIVLRLNNREFQRWATMPDLLAFNAHKGNRTAGTQFVVLDFTERLARDEVGMTLGTVAATEEAGVQDFTLEFTLGTYTVTAASIVTAWADVEAPSANRIIQRVQFMQRTIAAAAEESVTVPFGKTGAQLKRWLVRHVNLTSVRIRRDGVDVYEDLPVAFANERLQDFGRTPSAGYHMVDLMPDSLQSNALNTAIVLGPDGRPATVQNLDTRVRVSAADTLTMYLETYALNSQL